MTKTSKSSEDFAAQVAAENTREALAQAAKGIVQNLRWLADEVEVRGLKSKPTGHIQAHTERDCEAEEAAGDGRKHHRRSGERTVYYNWTLADED